MAARRRQVRGDSRLWSRDGHQRAAAVGRACPVRLGQLHDHSAQARQRQRRAGLPEPPDGGRAAVRAAQRQPRCPRLLCQRLDLDAACGPDDAPLPVGRLLMGRGADGRGGGAHHARRAQRVDAGAARPWRVRRVGTAADGRDAGGVRGLATGQHDRPRRRAVRPGLHPSQRGLRAPCAGGVRRAEQARATNFGGSQASLLGRREAEIGSASRSSGGHEAWRVSEQSRWP
mmetsp:Transcript_1747/g.5653  ORF Transcript_1747/g.5653 Transcript_1747/m.5653 type:complete len:230 (+) Transcript_1747:256-945(+)